MTESNVSAERDRLIHILVVHFDMFRAKAEEAADLFLHVTPLYRNQPISLARLSYLYALLGAEQWIEAGQIWDQNPEEREAAYAEVRAALTPGKE